MNQERRNKLEEIRNQLESLVSDLETVKDEEQEAFDNMPEGLQGGERGEQMQENVNALEEAVSAAQEAADVTVPTAPEGEVLLLLRFKDAKGLASFVDEHFPAGSRIWEADALDTQRVANGPSYIILNKSETRGTAELVLPVEDEKPAEVMAEKAQEAIDNIDNVQ